MSTEYERRYGRYRYVKLFSQERLVSSRVENSRHSDHVRGRESGLFLHEVHHRVERIGDNDNERAWGVLFDTSSDLLDDVGVGLHEIITAHAGLTRKSRGHYTDVSARDIGDIVRSGYLEVETEYRREVREVECLSLRHPINHVKENYVTKVALSAQQSEGSTDLASADKRYLSSSN